MNVVAVIDFETTGLSPAMGDRATEVAVVIVDNGKIVDRYQSLMNAGVPIPHFVESLTGISSAMIRKSPPIAEVMIALAAFIGTVPLVAHNAAFDKKFLDAEWSRVKHQRKQEFVCSMLLARRIYPAAPDHKLATLVSHLKLPSAIRHHRALADAEMTAYLWLRMVADIKNKYGLSAVPHEFLCKLQKVSKAQVGNCINQEKHNLKM